MKIESVNLTIRAEHGEHLEIPLEVWQVDVISQMLVLSVDPSNLAEYKMATKESVDERMAMYYEAIKR